MKKLADNPHGGAIRCHPARCPPAAINCISWHLSMDRLTRSPGRLLARLSPTAERTRMLYFEAMSRDALTHALRRHFGGEVRFDMTSRRLYSTDASIYQVLPLGVADSPLGPGLGDRRPDRRRTGDADRPGGRRNGSGDLFGWVWSSIAPSTSIRSSKSISATRRIAQVKWRSP